MLLPAHRFTLLASLADHLGDSLWAALDSVGVNLPDMIAERRIAEQRSEAFSRFEQNIRSGSWQEAEWQAFFTDNTWIFGYGLTYRFLSLVEDQPETGGRGVAGSGAVQGDYLLATEADKRFTVLVEIKRPNSELVREQLYRNHAHKLSDDLVGAVVQVQQQCHQWEVQGARSDENRECLEQKGIYTYRPKGIVVIGDTASLVTLDKRRAFELYRRNLVNPEIVTFDELLERARFVVCESTI